MKITFYLSEPLIVNTTSAGIPMADGSVKAVMERILWLLGKMEEAERKTGVNWINAL